MMAKRDIGKTVKNKSCLKVSDWVTFLASEKHGMTSTILSFGLFLVALVSILLVGGENFVMAIIGGIVAFGCLGLAYYKVLKPVGKRGKLAEEILERIMSGKLENGSTIREEWEEGLAALKQARRCQWKAGLAALKRTRCRRGSSDK